MMIFTQFSLFLQDSLKHSKYVLFEHFLMQQNFSKYNIHILLKDDIDSLVSDLRSFPQLQNLAISKTKNNTLISVSFKNGEKCSLNVMDSIVYQGKEILDMKMILAKRQKSVSDFYMPNIEHLFEFSILNHFLNNKGINEKYQAYFDGFHFFVKEGLIEFFNDKYGTSFKNVDELAVFKKKSKDAMMDYVDRLPANQFFGQMNVRWHNFLGHLRQARII